MKRKILLAVLAVMGALPTSGCFFNRYDSDPNYRMRQMLNESENLRNAHEEIHRFWMNQQPSALTYDRLNGAIGPG